MPRRGNYGFGKFNPHTSQLKALAALAKNANARIYIGFDKHTVAEMAKNEN